MLPLGGVSVGDRGDHHDPALSVPILTFLREGSVGARLQEHCISACQPFARLPYEDYAKSRAKDLPSRAARRGNGRPGLSCDH